VGALAIEALGKLGDKAATPKVIAELSSSVATRRAAAAMALWRLADSTALEPLLAREQDQDPETRWRVIYALEKIVAPTGSFRWSPGISMTRVPGCACTPHGRSDARRARGRRRICFARCSNAKFPWW
jgi:hypothetical protein